MTEEEIQAKEAADAKAKDEEEANAGVRLLAEKDDQIKKISEERDNYKHVALKRLGKNPGDADFVAGADETTGLTIEETVRKALLDRELDRLVADKDTQMARMAKENAELKLALKNRPGGSMGGSGGATVEVKDNVFSAEQLENLKQKALRLKADPEKFIQAAKDNISRRS